MLGLINSIVSFSGTIARYVRQGLVMANTFKPEGLTHPVQASAEFNGTSDYIQLDTPFSYTNHTIAAWVYANDDATNKMFLDARDASDDGILFNVNTTEGIRYSVNASDVDSTTTHGNEWVYVVGTYDGTTQRLYIDGSQNNSAATSQTISTTTDATIGRASNSAIGFFEGNLANVAIWNRALSSDEINSVMWKTYEQVSTTESNGLQAWYKLSADEVLSDDSTATLTTYANANGLTFEQPQCVQDALTALPTADAGRVLFDAYDVRVIADGGSTEARTCTINELNAIL
jgi:hypothetical protein